MTKKEPFTADHTDGLFEIELKLHHLTKPHVIGLIVHQLDVGITKNIHVKIPPKTLDSEKQECLNDFLDEGDEVFLKINAKYFADSHEHTLIKDGLELSEATKAAHSEWNS